MRGLKYFSSNYQITTKILTNQSPLLNCSVFLNGSNPMCTHGKRVTWRQKETERALTRDPHAFSKRHPTRRGSLINTHSRNGSSFLPHISSSLSLILLSLSSSSSSLYLIAFLEEKDVDSDYPSQSQLPSPGRH